MSNFIFTDRKTEYLLPPSVDNWLTKTILRALSLKASTAWTCPT